MADTEKYDLIIIGSGMGALTLGAIMARFERKKVLILERHYVVGGLSHEFERKGKYKFDVGVHYIGEIVEFAIFNRLFRYVSEDRLVWNRMPDIFDKFVYPDFTFGVPSNVSRYREALIERFPGEKDAITQYFKDVISVMGWVVRHMFINFMPFPINLSLKAFQPFADKTARMTTGEYMDRHFKDQKLKALLVSQWGDYGVPPAKSAFAYHCIIVNHYFDGGFYPEGGASSFAKSILPTIEQKGGKCLVSREVTEILIENGTAVGVKAKVLDKKSAAAEETYYAKNIVSNIGAENTYRRLIPDHTPQVIKDELKSFDDLSYSCVAAYLAFKGSPAKLGVQGENLWIYTGYDHDRTFRETRLDGPFRPNHCYVSFPSLKDKKATCHNCEVLFFVDQKDFRKWQNQPWQKRDAEYYRLKEEMLEGLINFVDERLPGFKDLIEYKELSTPLSMEHFTNHPNGRMYGLPVTPSRLDMECVKPRTSIKNFYLTGQDLGCLGICGAMLGSMGTACALSPFMVPMFFFPNLYLLPPNPKIVR